VVPIAFTTTEKVNIWLAVASALVAFATLYLALKTRGMVTETKRVAEATEIEAKNVAAQASATERQARISTDALRAAVLPWLTAGREGAARNVRVSRSGAQLIVVQLLLRNVGAGIALIPPDGCTIHGGGPPGTVLDREGYAETPVLPPGDQSWITFQIEGPDIDSNRFLGMDNSWGQITASVVYTDGDGELAMRADVHLAAQDKAGLGWVFNTIDYVRAPGSPEWEEDFVTVKFRPTD
jgi:hypothetical protein